MTGSGPRVDGRRPARTLRAAIRKESPMIAAILIALAAGQTEPVPTMNGIYSLGNPNYQQDSSVHVASVNNPVYSFPSGVDEQAYTNGRLYKGAAIIGGLDVAPKTDLAHAAASYGAMGDEAVRVQAEIQGLFRFHPTSTVEMSPWAPVPTQRNSPATDSYSRAQEKMARRAEDARQQWLKDNNYVGGVRTFVNDAELYSAPAAKKTELPKPRGVIQLSPDVPAFRSRMHVQGTVHLPPNMRTASLVKVVGPDAAPTVAKAEEKPATKVAAK
jgi:hypothetical protein